MIGPVSGTGRAMMASLQQAIQKGMPPDQAIQYVKSMATQGVAPMADLYAMMNQFQRLKQQPVQAPQTPPTIRDQLNMAEQQQRQQQMAMQQGLGGLPAPVMDNAQFAGGGIVAFEEGGEVNPISYMQRLIREALARGDVEAAEEIRASLSDYTSLGRNLPRISLPERSNLVDPREARFREQYRNAAPAAKPIPSASAVPTAPVETRPRLGREATASEVRFPGDTTPAATAPAAAPRVAAPRTAAPRTAAPAETEAAPKLEDFYDRLRKTGEIGRQAIEDYRNSLTRDEAEIKARSSRDRMLALAQAGFGIAEASSRRGRDRTTFLGAVGAAGTNFAKNIMQLNREADAERRGIAKERLALAQAESAGDRADYVAAYDQLEKRITRLDEQRFRMQTLIEQRLDRVMRQSLGMAQIAESRASREADRDLRERGVVVQERLATATEDKNFATIKTEALANAYDALEKLQSNPAFMKLSTEEQYRKAEEIFKRFEAVAVQRLRNSGFVSGNNPYAQLSDDDLRKRLGI